MSLCTPLTVSPAWIEADRRNARKSTRPRTARGKVQSRMNALRDGDRSPLFPDLGLVLLHAPPGAVDKAGRTRMMLLPPGKTPREATIYMKRKELKANYINLLEIVWCW